MSSSYKPRVVALLVIATFVVLGGAFLYAEYLTKPKSPHLEGTLIFHKYTNYNSWDGELFVLDLQSKKLVNLTRAWKTVEHTINGHFSGDGQYLTFMGTQKGIRDWDVFLSKWNSTLHQWSEPRNLTGPNGKRDEDPKFSPINNQIVYKEDGNLTAIDVSTNQSSPIRSELSGISMPYFLPNGRDLLFESGGNIYLKKSTKTTLMNTGKGRSAYYPIAQDKSSYLFTLVQESGRDAIMVGYYNQSAPKKLFFNSDLWDSSDPYPYKDGSRYVFYVSGDYSIPKGGYNLMIADIDSKKTFNIDDLFGSVNSDLEELGPAWTSYRFYIN